jgi:hypothetical protein
MARQRYTPATAATNSPSSATTSDSVVPNSLHNSADSSALPGGLCPGGTDNVPNSRRASSWIVFGIRDPYEYDHIENIEASSLMDDPLFFTELKKRFAKRCWFFQRWISPYRFRYCRFVQVTIQSKHIGP